MFQLPKFSIVPTFVGPEAIGAQRKVHLQVPVAILAAPQQEAMTLT